MASVLVATCLSAASQDQSDFFGQKPPSAASEPEMPVPDVQISTPKKTVITNRNDEAARQSEFGAARPGQVQAEGDHGARTAPAPAKAPPSEFQRFVFDSTGVMLPVFGADFFRNGLSTFAPVTGAPVPDDYLLGAGDELLIRGWGSIDIDYRARIDRNGLISLPTVGTIVLAGVKAGDAEAVVRGAVARLYKGVTISVNFGQLRAITIYVVGQANHPGTYVVPSLSTLVTAVFASGGPNANGSMRRVQVKRGGKVAAELDLYGFIAKGDKSADIKLRDGDTVFIPAALGHVALVGKVNTPAVYELRGSDDTVASLLEFAGGMPVVADPRRAFLERIDSNRSQPRSVEQFVLNGEGLKRPLKNGDLLNLTSITPEFSNAVILRGNVDQPIRAPFKQGMRVSDLIPSRDYLITRDSVKRQNNVVGIESDEERWSGTAAADGALRARKNGSVAERIGGLIDEINWDYAVVERVNRNNLTVVLIPFNLGKVFLDPAGTDNIQLQPGDRVTVFSQNDVAVPMDKRRVFVRVEGEVNTPGVYQMTAGEDLQGLLARAGGPTANAYLLGTAFYREQVRKEQQENLEKIANRLETQLRNEQSSAAANVRATGDPDLAQARLQADLLAGKESIARLRSLKPTGRIAFGLNPNEKAFQRLPRLKLENGDRLVVSSVPEFVHVFGAVNAESSPLWRPNGRVSDYLRMIGLRADADRDNIFILRLDGSVVSQDSGSWLFGGFGGVIVMPGDSIVVPEKFDKETAWTKFTKGTREWAQIFANFGLGAAAIKVLK